MTYDDLVIDRLAEETVDVFDVRGDHFIDCVQNVAAGSDELSAGVLKVHTVFFVSNKQNGVI